MTGSSGKKRGAWALGLVLMLSAGAAGAAPKTQSDVLFEQGKELYDAGKFEEAAAKLSESHRLDPSVGTLGLLAACEEKRGRLAHAYENFVETARLASDKKDAREKYANERAEALKPRVPRLVIRVDAAIVSPRVTRGGVLVPEDQIGAEILVDPGETEIVGTGAGKGEFRQKVTLSESSRVEVFVRLPVTSDSVPTPFPPPGPREHPTMRALSFVAGGLGLAGIGVGTFFGVRAISKNKDSKTSCVPFPAGQCPDRDAAFTAATGSTVSFAVGLAALGAGVALFVASRPDPAPPAKASGMSVTIVPTAGGAAMMGSF